ncbi:hypothetical protein BAE44_0016043 [Dichanthelium oligosanthes]|uniref:Uncharacterized protein n=1 Tax=Dichanthelium oligosanthes TaxID=888268 RepID=A0A1E5VCR8_9POAL|nr:hypothetical protein BAE44_0016043 [Dichanthelium oligosanthes]
MGPSRRPFLNLIVDDRIPGARSLRCHQFFYQTTPPRSPNGDGSVEEPPQDAASWAPAADAGNHKDQQAAGASVKMKRIRLPSPILSFHASAARYTCGINCFPVAGRRKVLCADQSGRSFLFDADTAKHTATSFAKSWRHCLLPPPPLVCDPKHRGEFHRITTCAVVGSQICVSVEDAGTYCLDTDRHLAAADLSAMDSQPQVVGAWNELEQPEKWQDDIMNPQLVNLGSGRFCVARFFYACTGTTIVHFDLEPVLEHFAVLTGVEVIAATCSRR